MFAVTSSLACKAEAEKINGNIALVGSVGPQLADIAKCINNLEYTKLSKSKMNLLIQHQRNGNETVQSTDSQTEKNQNIQTEPPIEPEPPMEPEPPIEPEPPMEPLES